jgi:hypothetical protein
MNIGQIYETVLCLAELGCEKFTPILTEQILDQINELTDEAGILMF